MTAALRPAVLALGGNLPSPAGDPFATLCSAVDHLARELWVSAVSPVYETDPVGGPAGQPAYLNAVVLVETQLSPHAEDREQDIGDGKKEGGNADREKKEVDLGPRLEQHKAEDHAADRSRRAQRAIVWLALVRQKGPYAPRERAPQIERQIAPPRQRMLHQRTEEVEGQHVQKEVPRAGVEERRSDELIPAPIPHDLVGALGEVTNRTARHPAGHAGGDGEAEDEQREW